MKNQFNDIVLQAKVFFRKNAVLLFSIKVVKIIILFLFVSCSGASEKASDAPDTVKVDITDTKLPGDTALYNYVEEEGDDEDDVFDDQEGVTTQDM